MSWVADKIEHWPLARLLPYANNARTHSDEQIAQIAASIVEFGFTNPILVGSDGVIVAGHGRLSAARKLGLDGVPVVVLDHLSPTQRRALVIASQKTEIAVTHSVPPCGPRPLFFCTLPSRAGRAPLAAKWPR